MSGAIINLLNIEKIVKRLETKVMRGFEELGVDVLAEEGWLTVDDASRTIYVSSTGRSFSLMKKEADKLGATQWDKPYDIVHKGDVIGTMILRRWN